MMMLMRGQCFKINGALWVFFAAANMHMRQILRMELSVATECRCMMVTMVTGQRIVPCSTWTASSCVLSTKATVCWPAWYAPSACCYSCFFLAHQNLWLARNLSFAWWEFCCRCMHCLLLACLQPYTAFAHRHHLLAPLHKKLLKNSCCPLK